MSWAWITGDLTEHEMEMEHGHELEKIRAQPKGELNEFSKAAALGVEGSTLCLREKKRAFLSGGSLAMSRI